jgi:parallel beta-helix repeat protein
MNMNRRSFVRGSAAVAVTAGAVISMEQAALAVLAGQGPPTDWWDVTITAAGFLPADNTGASDAASAIQARINAAATANGGIVYLPKGNYRVDTTLVVKKNVTLLGAGTGTSIRPNAAPLWTPPVGSPVIKFDSDCNHGCVANLQINGKALQPADLQTVGIQIEPSTLGMSQPDQFNVVRDVEVFGVSGHGVFVNPGAGGTAVPPRANHFFNVNVIETGRGTASNRHGFNVGGSDHIFDSCLVGAAGTIISGNFTNRFCHSFNITGGNNQLTNCKGYYGAGDGFRISANRNTLANCQSQDNNGVGFTLENASDCTLSGIVADTSGLAEAGLWIWGGSWNTVASAVIMCRAGGRFGATVALNRPVKYVFFQTNGANTATNNIVTGTIREATSAGGPKIAGTTAGNNIANVLI